MPTQSKAKDRLFNVTSLLFASACVVAGLVVFSQLPSSTPTNEIKQRADNWKASAVPYVVSARFFSGNGAIETRCETKNTLNIPIATAEFCIQVMQENRQTPLSSSITVISIPGGIEPGETRTIKATVSASIFPDDPGENTGKFVRVALVGYQPLHQSPVELVDVQSCKCTHFDAYAAPDNSVGIGDTRATATHPMGNMMQRIDEELLKEKAKQFRNK